MNDNKREETGKDAVTIKPADIQLTGASTPDKPTSSAVVDKKPGRFMWAGLLVLMCIALAVIFILPRWIQPTVEVSPDNEAVSSPAGVSGAAHTAPSGASPWDEAQQAKLRKTSQELLEKMLEAQNVLEQKGVKTWAADKYGHALGLAKQGDAAYGEQQFQQANDDYGQALKELTGLVESMGTIFNETLKKGKQALADGDTNQAGAAFDLALTIKPNDPDARRGKQRALTLDRVLALMEKGNELQQNGDLEEARKVYRQALDLDQYAERAAKQLKLVDQKIRDRDFNNFMSAGYTSLEKNRLADARKAFEQALKLKPGANEAKSALEQTALRITNNRINSHLSKAREYEKKENWSEAVSAYDQALSLDGSLVPAREGRQYAAMRAALDEKLETTLSRPDRLTDKTVHDEAAALEQQAATIADPGPRLSRQIEMLSSLLQLASTPVNVTFKSDNQTNVTLYKIGDLGRFENKQLSLLPGRYTVIGNRQGYRDVRVEFIVYTGKNVPPVVVQCNEKIALGK